MTAKRIIRTYLAITASTVLAQSLIWGVNTLFLLAAGLDILEVMIANGAFTLGQMLFEVPTGVVADTLGRRASYILSVITVMLGTLAYLLVWNLRGGVWWFSAASLLLGLGFTFYSGAVDAWMIDALAYVGYAEKVDPIFGRAGIAGGIAMLFGTIGGGILGQRALWIPYVARTVMLLGALGIGIWAMPELGFEPRRPRLSEFGEETAKVARDGVRFGLRSPVISALVLATLAGSLFAFYGFYSWQKYFLDLLGKPLVWVAGVIAAAIGLSQVAGGALVGPLTRSVPRRSTCVAALTIMLTAFTVVAGVVGLVPGLAASAFWIAVSLYVLSGVAFGAMTPINAAWLNACVPSDKRATVISMSSLMGNAGGTAGQLGLGYLSRVASIPVAWVIGGASQALALPFVALARKRDPAADAGDACQVSPVTVDVGR